MNKKTRNPFNVHVITLGCKVNQFESESIEAELDKLDFSDHSHADCKDICIINTCTVTQKASMQSRQAIRKAIRDNPNAIIFATGCYAQSEPLELKKIKGIDYIIGNTEKNRIAQIISELKSNHKTLSPIMVHTDIRNKKNISKTIMPAIDNRTRPFIRIQDGCDNFCSYCIVPYTRGPSRSLPPEEVLEMISALPAIKRQEIVLTGIHIGKYGLDLSSPVSLLSLLQQINDAKIVGRIRLSSIEPAELTDDLIEFAADSSGMCHHFHIPLQSGDKYILKKMNRPYDPGMFEKLIQKIHRTIPDAAIGVDVMVGFPGETEEAFMNTYSLLKALPVTYLHVFPFSSRPGTKASNFPNHVRLDIIKKRRNILLDLSRTKKTDFYSKMIGNTLNVLIENNRELSTGKLTGVSSNYVRVLADGNDQLKNKISPYRITRIISSDAVCGEIMS